MFKYIIFLSVIFAAVHTTGFGFSIGPFSIGGSDNSYTNPTLRYRTGQLPVIQRSTICDAISQQKKIQMVIRQIERSDPKEWKIVTKKITFEPYVFGLDQNRGPVLRGQVVEEKVLREITIRNFDDETTATAPEKDELLTQQEQEEIKTATAVPAKGEIGEVNLRFVRNFRVIQDSQFETPKDFDKIFKDTLTQVFCHINRPAEK